MKTKYTSEKNIQILISLLKKYNIKNVIASPGTTNISFVASLQMDDFFNLYSCVDERSAAYMACGMAAETGEPVVLTCTGATASRNYIPGLTEAFYRKLPVIAVTATQHFGRIGQNVAQVIDRSVQLNDIVKKSIQLRQVHTEEDKWACNLQVNNILQELTRNGGGPIHINMETVYSNEFVFGELPDEKMISRIKITDIIPTIHQKNVVIFIGNHEIIKDSLQSEIEMFCEKYNGIVLCDHTSNYHGKYKILGNLICSQSNTSKIRNIDLLIDIGNISGAYMGISPKEVWRISEDGEIRDTFKKIKYIFDMPEIEFFKKYNKLTNTESNLDYYNIWKNENDTLYSKLNQKKLPFSNLWISKNVIDKIEEESIVHIAVLNTLRAWNYFDTEKKLNIYCNTGGFGIDGIMSTALGASLVTSKNVYCCIGDLAFFYDLNSIGNKELKNNFRILLINNGTGTEFHNYNHRAQIVSNKNNISSTFFAADGHFGSKSSTLVKHYAEDLGFIYLSAKNKEEFLENLEKFISSESEKPILFETFTDSNEESQALKIINTLNGEGKDTIKKILGEKNIRRIKKFLGK